MNGIVVRRALRSDASEMARLHVERIDEGFLSSLGVAFLARLYGRVVASRDCMAHVAVEPSGRILGFVAASSDVGRLYRRFVVRDGAVAGLLAAPRIARSLPRVLETQRYPAKASAPTGAGSLPHAELLAVAVDGAAAGRGVGRALVEACARDIGRLGVDAMKVVAASHNEAARSLYAGASFVEEATITVHEGTQSSVYVRRDLASSPAKSAARALRTVRG